MTADDQLDALLPDTGDARLPLYQRLRDAMIGRIVAGDWAPGTAIPAEAEIARANGVAVGTVRKALDTLVAEGVLDKVQGRGTFVRRPSLDRSLFRFFRAEDASGARTLPEGRILARKVAPCPAEPAAALGLAPRTPALRIDRLRLIDGTPVFAEEIWLPRERFAPLEELALTGFGDLLYPLYERLCGEVVALADETLTVDLATAADARLLDIAKGAPVVVVDRIARGFDRHAIEWRRSRGPADRFRYRIEIR
ncbi:GntR family transcriptional regulator [Azorhizobium doebereinerae]|uniref:GntR family transcriptional regulator n=1 Tax=Azorhizobium doebereinerae TaxID=281091 RepID=UPI000428C2C8|nr:GntR family transcriptional regulator [Azorhizobium doebereinerae]